MIHFTCEHCKKSVRVDDRFGGKTGRCPHCKQTVAIPAVDALSALAAAASPQKLDDTSQAFVPPPPGVGLDEAEPSLEELTLPEKDNVDLADTVILPAGIFVEKVPKQEGSPARTASAASHHGSLNHHRPALNALRTILILVAVFVVLIVAVLGFALASKLL